MYIYTYVITQYSTLYLKCLNSCTPHQKKSPKIPITNIVFLYTDQEGAEEDEGDEVKVGKVTSAIISHGSWEFIAGAVAEACQHYLVPCLARGTPEEQAHLSKSEHYSYWAGVYSCKIDIFRIYLKRRVKAWKKVWKLLWWFIALSSINSMFPNTWGSSRAGALRLTIISMHRVDWAILRSKKVSVNILRSVEHKNVFILENRPTGSFLYFICFHRWRNLNADTMLMPPSECFCITGKWRVENCYNCWCPNQRCRFELICPFSTSIPLTSLTTGTQGHPFDGLHICLFVFARLWGYIK